MQKQLLFRYLFCCLPAIFLSIKTNAQYPSAAQEEVQKQQALAAYPVAKWDSLRCAWYGECAGKMKSVVRPLTTACPLNKRMFGWHAIGTASTSYVWESLSDLSYFSYQVDYLTGNAVNAAQLVNWGNNATVLAAKANGVHVNLAVTFFGTSTSFGSFFANPTARQTLITNLVNHVVTADVKGLNIDFEGGAIVTASILPNYLSFLQNLRTQLLAARPTAEISVDIQGAHAGNSTYITGLNPLVDLFILMGYDYYWSGQNYPGPIAPTWQFPAVAGDPFGHGNVANDLNSLLRFAPVTKTLLGMPYYGFRWKSNNGCSLPGIGDGPRISTQTYADFRSNGFGYYSNTLRDVYSQSAYHCFNDVNGIPNQQFIDDAYSLQNKYDLIFQQGIAGGAVWRLGYDAGYSDLWDLINNNLSICAAMPCRDTVYDMGGPLNNYVNRSDYFFTIAPPGASAVSLRFLSFNFEENWDSVWVYDGIDTLNSPVLGRFSGTTLPPTLVAGSGKITIKVFTDGATTRPGFSALYNCSPQLVRSIASGDWNNPDTWETGSVPLATDNAMIMAGHMVTVSATNAVGTLQVNSGGSVLVSGTAVLNVLH